MKESETVLVIGASGQIGTELILRLRKGYGDDKVIAADIRLPSDSRLLKGPFEKLDTTDYTSVLDVVERYKVGTIYQLAAMLSATGEQNPQKAWDLNMNGLLNALNICKDNKHIKLFWPSSIAVFGPRTPKDQTPQFTVQEPSTIYGISKVAGEYWCNYYHEKYGVDVRSVRYPGIVGHQSEPGGGTTDYAVHIFYSAVKGEPFECFLSEDRKLPMMFMEDAIDATIKITEAPSSSIKIRTGYNLAAMSFSPAELAREIKKSLPDFEISYKPDFRDELAKTWPNSIDDSRAREDWSWGNKTGLADLVKIMLKEIQKKKENLETL